MQQDPPNVCAHTHTHVDSHTHIYRQSEGEGELACNRIYSHTHTHTFMLTREKKFAAHICSLYTDFHQADCIVHQSHCGSLGLQGEVKAHETQQAQGEQNRTERAEG